MVMGFLISFPVEEVTTSGESELSDICCNCPHHACNVSSRDVLHQNFESYKPEVQELICVADRLGSLMQYETPGFLPNKRIHRGILEIFLTKEQRMLTDAVLLEEIIYCAYSESPCDHNKCTDNFIQLSFEKRLFPALACVLLLCCRCRIYV